MHHRRSPRALRVVAGKEKRNMAGCALSSARRRGRQSFLFCCNLMWVLPFTCIKLVQAQVGLIFTGWARCAVNAEAGSARATGRSSRHMHRPVASRSDLVAALRRGTGRRPDVVRHPLPQPEQRPRRLPRCIRRQNRHRRDASLAAQPRPKRGAPEYGGPHRPSEDTRVDQRPQRGNFLAVSFVNRK